MNTWRKIVGFPTDLFVESFTLESVNARLKKKSSELLSPKVHAWFDDRGIQLNHTFLVFGLLSEFTAAGIHKDFAPTGIVNCALNIELHGASEMFFYEDGSPLQMETHFGEYDYAVYDHKNAKVVDSVRFEQRVPYLVNTSYPHRVRCLVGPRTLISLRFSIGENLLPTWEEAEHRMQLPV